MGRSRWMLLGAVAVTVLLFNVPYGQYVLYPFKLFATWLHESGHGLAAVLVGDHFERMVIRADTSGTAYHTTTGSVLTQAVVASAGYLGTAFFGAILLWLGSASERRARTVLGALGAVVVLMDLAFMRNAFGLVALGAIGLCLLAVARFGAPVIAEGLLHVLAAQSCVNALLDIRVLFAVGSSVVPGQGRSDAATMQELLLLPYWFWASLWMAISIGMLAGALWLVARRRRAPAARPRRAAS